MHEDSQGTLKEQDGRRAHADTTRRIKGRTGTGLNDAAKFLEPFAARLLNAAYDWDLKDPAPGVPNTKGIVVKTLAVFPAQNRTLAGRDGSRI